MKLFTRIAIIAVAVGAPLFSGWAQQPALNTTAPVAQSGTPQPPPPAAESGGRAPDSTKQQPKRILGVMPNFRAVSAGTIPPPPTPKQSFILATQNSFDYSSFIFVGITSALAEGTDAHPHSVKALTASAGITGAALSIRLTVIIWAIFILPTVFHQDERYFAMGEGGFWKRSTYAATRIFIARKYNGDNTFNVSEVLGRGIAQGISTTYYPSSPQCRRPCRQVRIRAGARCAYQRLSRVLARHCHARAASPPLSPGTIRHPVERFRSISGVNDFGLGVDAYGRQRRVPRASQDSIWSGSALSQN